MKARKPRVDPDRLPPCPACGVRYADWRGEYPGGFKGALSGHKASAWAMHCERCEAYPADAADFNPAAWDPASTYCERVYTADEWGADTETDPVAVCLTVAWEGRERMARVILGPDYDRVCGA